LHKNDLGQLLILKLNEERWSSSLEFLLRRLCPGGILLGAPFTHGSEATRDFLITLARAIPTVPFLAIEEEGGALDPLRAFLPPLPAPGTAAEKGPAAVSRLGELVGAALSLLGFNTDLAPVLDLASPTAAGISETRAFSSNPLEVAKCGAAFLSGLERYNVLACGKHFPGLETALYAGAAERPAESKSMAQLWREDLIPYRALLPRLPLVLVSTAAYKAYDFDLLQSAGLSPKVVEGLLRVKLGYNGVAIAYELETEAVRGTLALEEAAVQALRAGCDMLLSEKAEAAERVQRALSAARESGKLPTPRLEQALKRVQLAKQGLKPPRGPLSRRSLARVVREFTEFSSGFTGCGETETRGSKFENRKQKFDRHSG
jgi:beta-N-acetylhexosaminidase